MSIFGKKRKEADEKEKTESIIPVAKTQLAVLKVRLFEVLLQPRISEKASHSASVNKYVFLVAKSSNKVEIKKAVESKYKVRVVQVNIVNMKGKRKHFGRIKGKLSDFKKAIITLKEGDKIEGATETI
jgi:large subunit ribosomal protein L23